MPEQVFGCLRYGGPPKTLQDIQEPRHLRA